MRTKHKHAALIHAFADGAEIQFKDCAGDWNDIDKPTWCSNVEYRLKPLSEDEILRVATKSPPFIPWLLQEGVTLGDVRGMAVDFARAIEKAHGIGETE